MFSKIFFFWLEMFWNVPKKILRGGHFLGEGVCLSDCITDPIPWSLFMGPEIFPRADRKIFHRGKNLFCSKCSETSTIFFEGRGGHFGGRGLCVGLVKKSIVVKIPPCWVGIWPLQFFGAILMSLAHNNSLTINFTYLLHATPATTCTQHLRTAYTSPVWVPGFCDTIR